MAQPPSGFAGAKIAPACQGRFRFGRYFRSALYQMELSALKPELSALQAGKRPQQPGLDADEVLQSLDPLLVFLDQLHADVDEPFAKSFHLIADGKEYPSLKNKIALLYFDGNGFGNIQAKVGSVEEQAHFDRQIKTYRRGFLAQVLALFKDDRSRGVLRLETLLWGGDEMLFVVPASKGMALAQAFYRHSRDWAVELGGESFRLSHAGGLVFCHHKTPVARAAGLARDLAEAVKGRRYGREGNYFDYMALESIDYPAEPLATFVAKRYGKLLARCRYPLPAALDWDAAKAAAVLGATPKSQAYDIARKALAVSPPPAKSGEKPPRPVRLRRRGEFVEQRRRFELLQAQTSLVKDLQAVLWQDLLRPPCAAQPAADRWQWLHLVELWDYLAPQAETQEVGHV